MSAPKINNPEKLDFQYLPAFANYLLTSHLKDFVKEQIRLSKEVNIPLLKYFEAWTEEQLLDFSMKTSGEFLTYLSENRAGEQIAGSIQRWLQNQLPIIERQNVVAADITFISYVRKQTFLKFLPLYTSDISQILQLISDIDRYMLELDKALINTYINLQLDKQKQIAEQLSNSEEMLLEAQELAGIGSYEWDLILDEANVTPQLEKILEIKGHRLKEFMNHVHESDREKVRIELEKAFVTGIYDSEFRYVVNGTEKVLWSRGKVDFENGKAYRMTGTIMDITQRQELVKRLQKSEQLFKQAQALTHLGNYTWDIETNKLTWSDEMYKIYGMPPETEVTYEKVFLFNHPDDIQHVKDQLEEALKKNEPFNFYYRIVTADQTEKILHARGELISNNGKVSKVIGTAQDVTERQTLIRKLEQSEELYKQAQSISHVGNWTMDVKTKEFIWSDEMFRIYGLTLKSNPVQYETFLSLIHSADQQKVHSQINKCIQTGKDYDMLHRIALADGTIKIVHRRGKVEKNKDGEPVKIVGTTQDITEYKKIEKELLENRNFIQKIADATPSIIASYNINTGEYRFISKGLKKLLGYEPEQVMEEGVAFFANIIHPDDISPVMEKNAQALEVANQAQDPDTPLIVEFQYRMRHKNGQYRWFHTYGTIFDRNNEGKVEHVLNISIDITERMEAEQKIEEQEYFIKQIAGSSPTILYLFSVKEGTVIYINKEIENVLGYTPHEIFSMGDQVIPNLYHPGDAAEMTERLKEYNKSQNPKALFQFECKMKHKNGEWRWLLVREIVFKRNKEGKVVQVLGSALDMTQRKEIEEKLFHQTIELQQSNTSLEEFAYVASHDLKEPLRKISTFGDRLLKTQQANLDSESQEYLAKIITSSRRMQLMINDLLSISMISGNKEFERHSLQSILEDVKQSLEHKIEENKAVIVSDQLPEANIVPSQFRQLFQNLLSNSLKFVRPDVQPYISVTHNFLKQQDVISLKLSKSNSYLKIQISDNGIGFDKAFSDKIFAIFQRLHNKSEYEGTGIGLAICKKIIENHGGTIFASGVQNQGSTFTIIIPV